MAWGQNGHVSLFGKNIYRSATIFEIIKNLLLFKKTRVCEIRVCRVTRVSQTRVLWKNFDGTCIP